MCAFHQLFVKVCFVVKPFVVSQFGNLNHVSYSNVAASFNFVVGVFHFECFAFARSFFQILEVQFISSTMTSLLFHNRVLVVAMLLSTFWNDISWCRLFTHPSSDRMLHTRM